MAVDPSRGVAPRVVFKSRKGCREKGPLMARRRLRVWITRAQPGADATAERVRALGHEAVVAPLLAVRPLSDVEIDLTGVAALALHQC